MRKISALLLLAHILVLPLVAQSQSTKVLSDYIKGTACRASDPTGRSDSQSETNDRKWSMSWRISIKKDLP